MPELQRPTPFVQWAGGKRSLLATILPLLPIRFPGYHEPFLGGGAVAFALRGEGYTGPMDLSDTNERLITTYQVVQNDVESLIKAIRRLVVRHDTEAFYRARKRFATETDPVRLAALFIYLNRTAFNGLYRVNRKNEFNVAIGTPKSSSSAILDARQLRAASAALQGAVLSSRDFADVEVFPGDLYYFDPPYDGTYSGYQSGGFTEADQRRLATLCAGIDTAGGYVLVSNADTPLVRDLYHSFGLEIVHAPRTISRNGSGRGRRPELLMLGRTFAEAALAG